MIPIKISALQALPGWSYDDSSSIGPTPPSIHSMTPFGQAPTPTPSGLHLSITGIKGKYCDAMFKQVVKWPAGANNIQLGWTFVIPPGVSEGIQALEFGHRPTSQSRFTGNGQVQADYSKAPGTMEFDMVPSAAGGWQSTGIVLPRFTEAVPHTEVLTYAYNPADETFSVLSIGIDGTTHLVPKNLQNVKMEKMGWEPGETVVGIQPDANPKGLTVGIEVLDCWMMFW